MKQNRTIAKVTWAAWFGAWNSFGVSFCTRWTVLISLVAFRLTFYDPFLGSFAAADATVTKVSP